MANKSNFEVIKKTLPNGMRVLFYEMPWCNSMTAELWVQSGPRYETEQTSGYSHFLEHVLFDGTDKYLTNKDLMRAVELLEGDLDAYTEKEYTVFKAKFPAVNASPAVEFLYDVLFKPLLTEHAISRQKDIINQEIKLRQSSLENYRWDILLKSIWSKDNPLSRATMGSDQSLAKITRQTLLDFKNSFYKPSNMILVVTGGVHKDIWPVVQETFGKILNNKSESKSKIIPITADNIENSQLFVKNFSDHLQSQLFISFITNFSRTSKLLMEFKILDAILRRKIFNELVYNSGISYDASSNVWIFSDHGLEIIFGNINPDKLLKGFSDILEIIKNLTFSIDEINETKSALKKLIFLNLADSDDFSTYIAEQEFFTGQVKSPEEIRQEIDRVTVEDLQILHREIFVPEKMSVVILGSIPENTKERLMSMMDKWHI